MMPARQKIRITWNPLDKHSDVILSNGNLTASRTVPAGNSIYSVVRATELLTGKHYFEVKVETNPATDSQGVGIIKATASISSFPTPQGPDIACWDSVGTAYFPGGYASLGTWAFNDVIGVAVDIPNLKIYFSKNGTWLDGVNPSAGTGGYSFGAGDWKFFNGFWRPFQMTATFNAPFAHAVPTGYN